MQDAESAFHNTIGHHTLTILQFLLQFCVYSWLSMLHPSNYLIIVSIML